MTIDVLLFGPQAGLHGAPLARIEVDQVTTAGDVLRALADAAPALRDSLRKSRLAVNHEFVGPGAPIAAGDEVALIGMVSGG